MAKKSIMSADDVYRELEGLEGRDIQLWSIIVLMLVVLAAGFVAVMLPGIMWNLPVIRIDGRYLPQLIFGLVSLTVLFNVYALQQRRALRATRRDLVQQLMARQAAEKLALLDPLTEIFNRRYLDQVLAKEVSRADRLGASLTFLMIDVDNFRVVNTQFGHVFGDRILKEVALVLRRTFRASDTIIRYGGDEFLVILTGTNEEQARHAVARLQSQVQTWNEENSTVGYVMGLCCGMAGYSKGANVQEVIELADQRMYARKAQQATPT